jgi:hypothetical protein
MPTVETFAAGDLFTVRTYKNPADNVGVKWSNTYDFEATASGTQVDLQHLVDSIRAFEIDMLKANYVVGAITVSTYVADSHPYNPLAFFTDVNPANGAVPVSPGTHALPLTVALYVERILHSGKQGKLFLRGTMDSGDVTTNDVGYQLNDMHAYAVRLGNAVNNNLAGSPNGGLGNDHFNMVVVTRGSGIGNIHPTRQVGSLNVNSVVSIKLNHKYFDRANSPK